ncbi:MAG: hypothetical protein ACRDHF_08655, partial [Tepidiformaceae bacterium]
DFARTRTFSPFNPALAPHARVNAQNIDHPLLRAVFDLEARLGVRDGVFALAPGHDASTDPTADTALAVTTAANEKGVTRETVYNAIERGELVATSERPLRVSGNSLRRWQPSAGRQRAGRLSAAARGADRRPRKGAPAASALRWLARLPHLAGVSVPPRPQRAATTPHGGGRSLTAPLRRGRRRDR